MKLAQMVTILALLGVEMPNAAAREAAPPGVSIEARTGFATARALAKAKLWREALRALNPVVKSAPRWDKALLLRVKIQIELAGPRSTLSELRRPRRGVDYAAMVKALEGAAADLTAVLKLNPDGPNADTIVESIGGLRARIVAAKEAGEKVGRRVHPARVASPRTPQVPPLPETKPRRGAGPGHRPGPSAPSLPAKPAAESPPAALPLSAIPRTLSWVKFGSQDEVVRFVRREIPSTRLAAAERNARSLWGQRSITIEMWNKRQHKFLVLAKRFGERIGAVIAQSRQGYPILPLSVLRKTVKPKGVSAGTWDSWLAKISRRLAARGHCRALVTFRNGNAFSVRFSARKDYTAVRYPIRFLRAGTYRRAEYGPSIRATSVSVSRYQSRGKSQHYLKPEWTYRKGTAVGLGSDAHARGPSAGRAKSESDRSDLASWE